MRKESVPKHPAEILRLEDHWDLVFQMHLHVLAKEERYGMDALHEPDRPTVEEGLGWRRAPYEFQFPRDHGTHPEYRVSPAMMGRIK